MGGATRKKKPGTSAALRIGRLLRPHWKALALTLAALVGETAADVLQPWPIKIIIDNVVQSKPIGGWLGAIVSAVLPANRYATLNLAVAAVAGIAIVDAASNYAEKYLTTRVAQWVAHDLRRSVYQHLQRLSLADHRESHAGDLMMRMTSDISAIQDFITSALVGVIVNVLTIAGILGVMFYVNWRFTLLATLRRPDPVRRRLRLHAADQGRVARRAQARGRAVVGRRRSALVDSRRAGVRARGLRGSPVRVREPQQRGSGAAGPEREGKAVADRQPDHRRRHVSRARLWRPPRDRRLDQRRRARRLPAVSQQAVQADSRSVEAHRHHREGVGRLRADPGSPGAREPRPRSADAREAPALRGAIEFDGVSFGYGDTTVLSDVSFRIEPGQVAAIVGPSGTGKSTIVSLITRFYDPLSGAVRIDGTDIREYSLKSLRDQISFVLQDTLLFRATIWENIAYGKPDASIEDTVRAATLANAHEFITELPQGYATMVGDRGLTLSGGQRQRIAIARAIVRNTPILILDEPTSGLDAASEHAVVDALDRLMKGRTTVVIAHHLGTIRHADVIFVVKGARIVEQGTHDAADRDGRRLPRAAPPADGRYGVVCGRAIR